MAWSYRNGATTDVVKITLNSIEAGTSLEPQQIEALQEHQRELEERPADLTDLLAKIGDEQVTNNVSDDG